SQGGKISPMSFDSQAYKNSDVYKLMDDVKKANSDYLTFKKDQANARKQAKELEEQENRPWYEKAWDTTKTFTGEITGYYDYIRATEGVDPRTHAKLTAAQRTAAGAMALAGFIPFVGWAGRAAKGGVAIYRTAKVLNAADHALDAYKTTKGFAALQKTEKGLYGITAANGMAEGITGRDFQGNKLTEEQKQQSLMQAFSILGLGAASKFIGGKPANIPFNTYSKQYAQATAKNAQNTLREIGKQIGKVDVPVGAKVLKMAGNGPIQPKVLAVETKTLSEVKQGLGEKLAKKKEQKQVNKELGGGSEGAVNDRPIYTKGFEVEPKYSSYEQRVKTTPVNKGKWSSERAESLFISDKTGEIKKYLDEAGVDGVDYKNGMPDFSPFSKGEIKLENMTNDRKSNFSTADEELAKKWSTPEQKWTADDIADWREDNKYTWHELNDLETIQLVPSKINKVFKHLGGVGEYNIKVKLGE
ncbi:pre-toxin TG domain-containing protein, partial [Bacillus sp. MUM 13]|uniref:pre-toxin TG domain-containing protein n=1 Tax=Bacillus sp. MUM 13 TaxID=1678001 RepID=UPI000AC0A7B2